MGWQVKVQPGTCLGILWGSSVCESLLFSNKVITDFKFHGSLTNWVRKTEGWGEKEGWVGQDLSVISNEGWKSLSFL